MTHPRYSSEEIVERGEQMYAHNIRDKVETKYKGKFLALDIETGEYEIDGDMLAALDRAKAKHAEAALYVVRIGFPSAVKLGGGQRLAGR